MERGFIEVSNTFVITALLTLVAGIGIFLIACNMMSSNLEAMGSSYLKKLFSTVADNDFVGIGIGAIGTAAIQSSGATTVMIIGFVNAGIMTLRQAATVIFGANVGTTITGQIVALGLYGADSISTTVIFSAFAGIGAFIVSFSKNEKHKTIGGIIAGFGMLFVGLSMMSNAMESFAYLDSVKMFLASITNVILLVIIGALLTAIVQSSSVMTSVAITMVVSGLISLDQGIYITMGSNIGSCVVAILASLTSSKNAKRTALIHLLFNVGGVVVFLFFGYLIKALSGGAFSYGIIFSSLFPGVPQTQLAMFHTFFNVLCALLILPLTNLLVKFVTKVIPEEETSDDDLPHLYYLDEHMLNTPVIALAQLKKEIVNMAEIALKNYQRALTMFRDLSIEGKEEFEKNELELNYLNIELANYLTRMSGAKLNPKDSRFMANSYHVITDLERVGDYAENIVEYTEDVLELGEEVSDEAKNEINKLSSIMDDLYKNVIETYKTSSKEAYDKAGEYEDEIDDITDDMADNHVKRMQEGKCTPNIGSYYLSLLSDSERVADHFYNVAKSVKSYK